jgi:hypothetical protein
LSFSLVLLEAILASPSAAAAPCKPGFLRATLASIQSSLGLRPDPRARPVRARKVSAEEAAEMAEILAEANAAHAHVRVYHVGHLPAGGPSSGGGTRTFSTGTSRELVMSLNRGQHVYEFRIPRERMVQWEYEGRVRRMEDYDAVTGAINEEYRFNGLAVDQLKDYRVDRSDSGASHSP